MTSWRDYEQSEMLRASAEVETTLNVIDTVIDRLPIEYRWLARLVRSSTIAPEAALSLTEGRVRYLWSHYGVDGAVSRLAARSMPTRCDAGYLLVIQLDYVREAILSRSGLAIESRPPEVFLDSHAIPITMQSADDALQKASAELKITPMTLEFISRTFRQSFEVLLPF